MSIYFKGKLYTQFIRTIIEERKHSIFEDVSEKKAAAVINQLNDLLMLDETIGAVYNDMLSYLLYIREQHSYSLDEVINNNNLKSEGGFMSYEEAGSLVNYLIAAYGADIFFSLYKDEITLDEAYGKDIYELYKEWGEYIWLEYEDEMKDIMMTNFNVGI